jgi:hypothetical protein
MFPSCLASHNQTLSPASLFPLFLFFSLGLERSLGYALLKVPVDSALLVLAAALVSINLLADCIAQPPHRFFRRGQEFFYTF